MSLKSQSAVEFIILASFMILVIFGFFAVISPRILEAREEGNRKIAEDVADLAYREIETAKSVSDGYTRVFILPQNVNGINYTITLTDNRELVVNYLGHEHIKFLPVNVTGNISKGPVEIRKINNIIYLNVFKPQCQNGKDDDGDGLLDTSDPGCYAGCDYLASSKYMPDALEADSCACSAVAQCCSGMPLGTHYSLFDSTCGASQCWTLCLAAPVLKMKNNLFNIVSFLTDGSVILKGTLQQTNNPPVTANDEFILKDRNGKEVAVLNLRTGNMFITGNLIQNQSTLAPSASSNDFIVKDANNNVVSYIDESGNFYLRGSLTEKGNP